MKRMAVLFSQTHRPSRISALAIAAIVGLSLLSAPAMAHHSVGGTYDETKSIEIKGVIGDVKWRNPHVQVTVLVKNQQGLNETWNIEMASISTLRRRGIKTDFMAKGDSIHVFGLRAWKNPKQILARNLLLAQGQEIILSSTAPAHWPEQNVNAARDYNAGRDGETSAPELGIFKVWSLPTNQGGGSFWNKTYPLTESAKSELMNFDSHSENLVVGCEAKGMPTVMSQPYPIQFIQENNAIVLKLEEYDTVRTIAMSNDPAHRQADTKLGNSRGHWDDKSLVVTTTNINWASFDGRGIPLGKNAQLVERFTPTDDGSQLDYTMTINDPSTFTEPVVLTRYWHWYSDATLDPYNCEYSLTSH